MYISLKDKEGFIVEFIILIIIGFSILSFVAKNPQLLLGVLLLGAIGFVAGDYFSRGWGIFGMILGTVFVYADYEKDEKARLILGILAFGAIGFVLGDYFSRGWGLFGAIFGAVLVYAGVEGEE